MQAYGREPASFAMLARALPRAGQRHLRNGPSGAGAEPTGLPVAPSGTGPIPSERTPAERTSAALWRRYRSPQSIIYLAFAAVVLFFVARAPAFTTLSSLENIGRQAAAITVVSVGMTIVIVCAEIDLSVGSTVSLAGMVLAVLLSHGLAWPVALLATLGVGAGIGTVNGLLTGYLGVPSFLVTLGMLETLDALAKMITGTLSVSITDPGFLQVFGNGSLLGVPIPVWWGGAVVLLGGYLLHRSLFGRWVFASGGNRTAAMYAGIRTRRVVLASFVFSGVLAAFSGILLAGRASAGDPSVGSGMELAAIAAVILGGTDLFGGRGAVLGTVVGALFIGVVGIGLILMGAGAQTQELITGLIIIGAVTVNRLGRH